MYSLRPHADPGKRNERAWLLWPAWGYRVVAPRPQLRSARINHLQRAVLGILRAARLPAEELALRLGIHRELAALVVSELQRQRYVDGSCQVTEAGLLLLDEEEQPEGGQIATGLMSGWVFRDPWNANLWPFIAPSLEYVHTEPGSKGFPELVLGSIGNPWRQRAWMQQPVGCMEPAAPDASEILRASDRHQRCERRAGRLDLWEEEEREEAGPSSRPSTLLNRVSTIEPEPEPVFLVTYLYIPRSGADGEADWYACDFFGRGANPELRKLIEQVAKGDSGLARRIEEFVSRNKNQVAPDGFRQAVAAYQKEARCLLERTLTLDILHHAVAEPLAEMLAAWLEAKELGDGAARGRHRHVLVTCRRVLERLFRELAERWPLAGVADCLSLDPTISRERLEAAAAAMGLAEVPERFLAVGRRHLRSVANGGGSWRLGPVVAATLLQAVRDREHPLWRAADQEPELLVLIDRVAGQAGEAAHETDEHRFDPIAICDCINTTMRVTSLLLNIPYQPSREMICDEQEQEK
ncbi:MAG: hypothetical protein NZ890_19645 [Myxococcota bacterium]|nr:hypothetical protein [Myxococcota bacterium]